MQTFAVTLTLAAAAMPVAAQYQVRVERATHDLVLELVLTPDPVHATELSTRGNAWGLAPQVREVKCGEVSLERHSSGAWLVPPGCNRVSWRVIPDVISNRGADPSKQRTLAVGAGPWFLLAEPTSLLRPIGTSAASSIGDASDSDRLVGATPVAPGRFEVPPANSAPEFYVLGPAATVEHAVGDFEVTYVADEPSRVERLGLDQLHAKALSYLSAVVGPSKAGKSSSRTLLVIWLAARQANGPLGGAAGHRSLVANYVIDPSADEKRNRAMTLAIAAHEQFHQLVDMLRGEMRPLPVWLGESLAQYYGLKALLRADDSKPAQAIKNEFIDPSNRILDGLLKLNRRYASGDRSVYGRFYTQGATLWNEVDLAIIAATEGKQSLDDYLRDLLSSPLPADGTLPTAFVERLRAAGGTQIDQIIRTYVGQ